MTKLNGMETKIDHIKELLKKVTNILQEVISLKASIKLHEGTIRELTNKNTQLKKELKVSVTEVSSLNTKNTILTAEKKEAEIINKEHSESIKQLKMERKKLVFQLADL